MRHVAVIHETGLLGGGEVAEAVAALQTQVTRDFAATWGIDARVRLAATATADEELLYLVDDAAHADRLGLTSTVGGERPCAVVAVRPLLDAAAPWTVEASHALLELLADPLAVLAAEGLFQGRPALFALDVGDPVAGDEYDLDGVAVANFVLPTWFYRGPLRDETLVDFLGRLAEPFTLSPGGLAAYCTELGRWQTWYARRCPRWRRQPSPFARRRPTPRPNGGR